MIERYYVTLIHNIYNFPRSYSFIRGQNAPIDPNTLAERATKRLKAIELQNAIKEQLEEREKIKRMEDEKRHAEERAQEDRIRRQMLIEQERVEQEQRKQQDKLETERKKQEVMRLAIERAKQEAVIEKAKNKKNKNVYSDHEEEDTRRLSIPSPKINNIDVQNSVVSNSLQENTDVEVRDAPKVVSSSSPATEIERPIDDGEKILIGSPIRMRKKTVKTKRPETDEGDIEDNQKDATKDMNDIDGIALVLQGLPPIVPMLNNDLLSLNQNLSAMNNIQLAVMLAHQMQHLNPLNVPGYPVSEYPLRTPPSTAQSYSSVISGQYGISPGMQQFHSAHRIERASELNQNCIIIEPQSEMKSPKESVKEICLICDRKQKPGTIKSSVEMGTIPVAAIPHDRTFTRDHSGKKDATTITMDIESTFSPTTPCRIENEIPPILPQSPSQPNIETVEKSTQTDNKSDTNCCCQRHQHHHHHVYVKEIGTSRSPHHMKTHREDIKTIALDILASQAKDIDSDATISATLIRPKAQSELRQDPKDTIRLQDRPKWGVNRPMNQYVKASERDPFYVRNKRKKYKKRISEDVDNNNDNNNNISGSVDILVSRSTSPSLITSSTATDLSPINTKQNGSSRSICTEILPIKTDVNGRVYLNFREASMVMSEDEVRQNLRNRYTKMERIMNRRRTSDDIIGELGSKKPNDHNGRLTLDRTKRTNTDVDLETE